MRERPISVMIFGILNMAWAMFGLLAAVVSALFLARLSAHSPVMAQMNSNPAYVAWMKIATPMGIIVDFALLAAGIGLLMLQNWARILSICYGVYGIVITLVGTVFAYQMISSVTGQSPNGPPMVGAFATIGMVFGLLFGLAYPVLLIIFMTRPKVVAACGPEQTLPT